VIVAVCLGLLGYELLALRLRWPTISDLSHRFPWFLLVWGWWGLLGLHFLREARR